MRLSYAIFSLICCLFLSVAAFAQDEKEAGDQDAAQDRTAIIAEMKLTEEQAAAIEVVADQKGPIFVYGTSGGMGIRPKANGKMGVAPKLQVFADGKLVVSGGIGVEDVEGKFSEAEMISFLNFVVNTNDFYQLDSKKIAKTMSGKETGVVMDAPSTIGIVELKKGRHDVSIYALWNAIKKFPDFEEVKRFKAIEDRCTGIISQINLGDRGDEILKLVNAKVADLDLGLEPFALNEMRLANRMPNGRFQARFTRELPGAKARRIPPSTMHVIYFLKDPESEPEVMFYGLPKKK